VTDSAHADTFVLNNETTVTGVILTETSTEYEVRIPIGKVTISKDTVLKHIQQSKEENNALVQKWKEEKRAYKARVHGNNPFTQMKDGKRFVKHNGTWVSFEAFEKIQQETKKKQKEFIEAEVINDTEEKREKALEENKKRTFEFIQQGGADRSQRTQAILTEGTWLSEDTLNFITYYQNEETKAFAEALANAAEFYFEKIKTDLGLEIYFAFQERIELLIIEKDSQWKAATAEDLRLGNTTSLSSHFFKEIFLSLAADETEIVTMLAHEIARLVTREFALQTFSKRHIVPFWLIEGIAGFEGPIQSLDLPPDTVCDAIRKNYLVKLDRLLVLQEYPQAELEQKLFEEEARSIITFISKHYGEENMHAFVSKTIELYHRIMPKKIDYTRQNAQVLVKTLVAETFLKKDYSGFSTFEENWLRDLLRECQIEKRLTRS